ncbi:MAG: Uma2 family endonuclease [Catalinimonas sp.]
MEPLLAPLLNSPRLPEYVAELQPALERERADREAFWADLTKAEKSEFINGKVITRSPIRRRHGRASDLLFGLMNAFVNAHDLGCVGHEKYAVSLTRNVYEPDVCYWQKEVADEFTDEQLQFPAPDWIVEVLSESTERTDRGIKFEDYAAHGVREYWLVDTERRAVEQYHLVEGRFEPATRVGAGDRLRSRVLPDFAVPVAALFDPVANAVALAELLKN